MSPHPSPCLNPTDYGLILTTADTETTAQTLAQALIRRNLAACVSYFPLHSVYTWKGNVESGPEWQLYIKTKVSHFEAIQSLFQEIHPYEVPELVLLPLQLASQPYLQWMADQTA
ncbi:MAG: divalent-cation tolerance protein CutA [Prochlorothrix sp.]|nr:divalent-cation tolerance protein CutA [Prochlorothrix sp.]